MAPVVVDLLVYLLNIDLMSINKSIVLNILLVYKLEDYLGI